MSGFHDYFKFSADTEVVLASLGWAFASAELTLPRDAGIVDARFDDLRARLLHALRTIPMESEIARREYLAAPILLELSRHLEIKLRSEYAVNVSPRLHGVYDYFLQKGNVLLVIEAKNADMVRGFTQLAAELIALDAFADADLPLLYGAVTVGDSWRFGVLDRAEKRITQDISQFRIPADLDDLLAVLTGILQDVSLGR